MWQFSEDNRMAVGLLNEYEIKKYLNRKQTKIYKLAKQKSIRSKEEVLKIYEYICIITKVCPVCGNKLNISEESDGVHQKMWNIACKCGKFKTVWGTKPLFV